MSRVKVKFPEEKPLHKINVPVRIGDINYGNHVGNDAILSIIHEARMQLLQSWGWDELNIGGIGLIMADVMIAYKGEAFYGDNLDISIYVENLTDRSFDLLYLITTTRNDETKDIAHAKTGMITFDYKQRKITAMHDELKNRLEGRKF